MTPQYKMHEVDSRQLEKWQKSLDVVASLFQVPAALIMRVHKEQIEVLVSSCSPGNPYVPGEKAKLNTGLYCETVMATRNSLSVPNSLEDEHWKNNPDIALNMVSYYGIPLIWPDGDVFGTICVLDSTTRNYSAVYRDLLWEFKKIIENDFFIHDSYVEKLRESEALLQLVFENAPSILFLIDEDMRISKMNNIGMIFSGKKTDTAVGRRPGEVFDCINFCNSSEDCGSTVNCTECVFRRIIDDSFRAGKKSYKEEIEYVRYVDGHIEKNTILVSTYLIKSLLTEKRMLVAIDNITARKQAENAVKKSEARFRDLYDNAPSAYFSISADGEIKKCNRSAARLFGMSFEELLGKSMLDLCADTREGKGRADELFSRFRSGEAISNEILQMEKKDGSSIWIDLMLNGLGNVEEPGFEGRSVVIDVTEQKKQKELIENSLKQKETLLRELYHRTKNNMSVICSLISLKSREEKNESIKRFAEEIQSKIISMALVHEMLYKSSDLSSIDIHEYISGYLECFYEFCSFYKDFVRVDLQVGRMFCLIDTVIPFALVLNELLTNSYKYAFPEPCEGVITIRLFEKETDVISFTYMDNGVGVPEGFSLESLESLGILMIIQIIENQMKGAMKFDFSNGFRVDIDFPSTLYSVRV